MLDQEKVPSKTSDLIFNTIKMLPKSYRPICDFCGVICGLVWFQQKPPVTTLKASEIPEMVLCIKCYTEGNFPNILSSNDFIKCDLLSKLSSNEAQSQTRPSWSTEETNRLLELISKNHENWTEIEKQLGGTRTKEEIILHFLQLPLKNISSVHFLFENEEDQNTGKLPIENLLEASEPTVFSDFSNPLLQHVAIFKSLLEKIKSRKKNVPSEPQNVSLLESNNNKIKEENNNNTMNEENPAQKEEEKIGIEMEYDRENKDKIDEFDKKLDKILTFNEKEEEVIMSLEKETQETSRNLQLKEENKLRMIVNLLIDLQLSKLESKLTYLEEFEKLIWYEKTELEVLQRMNIAERVNLAFKKNELVKQINSQTQGGHHSTIGNHGVGLIGSRNEDSIMKMGEVAGKRQSEEIEDLGDVGGNSEQGGEQEEMQIREAAGEEETKQNFNI